MAILFGSLDMKHALLLAKEYLNIKGNDRHARKQTGDQAKSTVRLRKKAGRCAEDAYSQLEELKAIRKDIVSMRHCYVSYPSRMMSNMCCHLRASWNIS